MQNRKVTHPQAVNYGTMMLVDTQTNCVVYGGYGFCYERDIKE